jgi:hypothetical protein
MKRAKARLAAIDKAAAAYDSTARTLFAQQGEEIAAKFREFDPGNVSALRVAAASFVLLATQLEALAAQVEFNNNTAQNLRAKLDPANALLARIRSTFARPQQRDGQIDG